MCVYALARACMRSLSRVCVCVRVCVYVCVCACSRARQHARICASACISVTDLELYVMLTHPNLERNQIARVSFIVPLQCLLQVPTSDACCCRCPSRAAAGDDL